MTAALPQAERRPRVMLLMTPSTYRAGAFLAAAERLHLDIVQAIDLPAHLAEFWHVELGFDFTQPDQASAGIIDVVRHRPVDAILAVDDSATLVAARASASLGLPHNEPASALAARDKLVMRERLAAAGVPVPQFRAYPANGDPVEFAREVDFPCVVKPLRLSGSRGVIRADTPDEFRAAFARTTRIIAAEGYALESSKLLVEQFIPGVEVAVEGLLTGGELHVLALFDKPDPLDGPFFEETIYVTPSRLPTAWQAAIARRTAEAAAAIGLREGPVHAELRVNEDDVWPIELAGRSIGGLCSTILEFGAGMSLEELILRQAVGLPLPSLERSSEAVGVMMIPIPRGGVLRGVGGEPAARQVTGITGIEITAKLNQPIVPLPEGASYLGFIFARGNTPAEVESALRAAHARLSFRIEPTIMLQVVQS